MQCNIFNKQLKATGPEQQRPKLQPQMKYKANMPTTNASVTEQQSEKSQNQCYSGGMQR